MFDHEYSSPEAEDDAEERAWRERRSRQYLRALHDPQEWEDWMDEWENGHA